MPLSKQIFISEHCIDATPSQVGGLRNAFVEFLLSLGLDDRSKEAWKLTFTEAVNNAIEHGNKDNPLSHVYIRWWVSGNQVCLETQDSGSGPSKEQIEKPQLPEDPLAESGRGLFIIHNFADQVDHWISREGHIARITKSYPRLNSVLPQNEEMDAILDELSDCYESLSLFDRMAENLIGDESIEAFTQSGLELFMDAREYDAIHLEMRDENKEPEYMKLSRTRAYKTFGTAAIRHWDLLEESDSFSWNRIESENNFPENETYQQGCAVPLVVNDRIIGLLAVAYRKRTREIRSKDIHNLRALSDVIAVNISRSLMERVRDERKRLSMEMGIATRLQQQLLPLEAKVPVISGYELFYKSLSALEVAGDFVEVRQTSAGEYLGCVIDVMGKGVSAAILAGIFRSQFIAHAYTGGSLATFLERMNQTLETQLGGETMFITVFAFKLNVESGELSYAAAGHPPALLISGNGNCRQLESSAPPLGLFSQINCTSETIEMQPGDRFIAVTDGLYEWKNGDDIFGWEAMVDWFTARSDLPAEDCWRELQEQITSVRLADKTSQEDDETILILSKK